MATDQNGMSFLSRLLHEDWQGLVTWDEELYDPLFDSDVGLSSTTEPNHFLPTDHHEETEELGHSHLSPSTYLPNGPLSFDDYNASAPSSGAANPAVSGPPFSSLSNSQSFTTTATSPLFGSGSTGHEDSLKPWEDLTSSLAATVNSPLPETDEEIIMGGLDMSFPMASPRLFNPFVPGSAHTFNSLDVSASQAIASIGDWADQPHVMDLMPEVNQSQPIQIPQSSLPGYSDGLASVPEAVMTTQECFSPRAIAIPQPSRQSASYNPGMAKSRLDELLSSEVPQSPDPRRRLHSSLPNSSPKAEFKKRRSSHASPSPATKAIGWVSYQPDGQGKGLVPTGADVNQGKRQRGRVRGLTAEQRRDAALMRIIGACSNCKRRKEKCDPGTPCKSCLEHYKGTLVQHPCRDRLLSDSASSFLSRDLSWHPTSRFLTSSIDPRKIKALSGTSYNIPLNFGFGPPLRVPVHTLQLEEPETLIHDHIIYSWPPGDAKGDTHRNAVLPAALTADALSTLPETIDKHLSLLVNVDQHFASFPLYPSPLRILRDIYVFYRALPPQSPYWQTLHQALKLLVLIHIGGDTTLPTPSSDPILLQLIRLTMPSLISSDSGDNNNTPTPTPCFIRSQFGTVIPTLAHKLMKQVLESLEQLLLNQACHEWPHALATLLVLLMAVESIQYHAAKLPYHCLLDGGSGARDSNDRNDSRNTMERKSPAADQQAIDALLRMYHSCFPGCHARLHPEFRNPEPSRPEDVFVEGVKAAASKAGTEYLKRKASEERREGDMGWFFDRLVARLLVGQ